MYIGCTLYAPSLVFWAIIEYAIRERAQQIGATLKFAPVTNLATQNLAIERFIDSGVDAIIVGPSDFYGLNQSIQRALDASIPVIVVASEVPGCTPTATIVADNVEAAARVADTLAQRCGGQGAVAHILGPANHDASETRARGIRAAFARQPAMPIVFEAHGDWSRAQTADLIRTALIAHPEICAICAVSDLMALGALDAVREAGRDDIAIGGFDGIPDILREIQTGSIVATAYQDLQQMGHLAVDSALAAMQGQAVQAYRTISAKLITSETVTDAMLDTIQILPRLLTDISEQGRALTEERAVLRTLIDAMPDVHSYVKDREGRFLIANKTLAASVGVHHVADMIGKTDADFFPADMAAQFAADEQMVMQSGESVIAKMELNVDVHGRERWFLTNKVPLYNDQGDIVGIVGMSRDISDIKRAEEERASIQDAVIEAQRNLLRELSTPLIPISDEAIIVPLIGAVDTHRAQQLLETLLYGVATHHARVVILDITGVPLVDTQVAAVFIQATQAVRLLGARIILTGIRPEVAQTIVGLGFDLSGTITTGSLQNAITSVVRSERKGAKRTA